MEAVQDRVRTGRTPADLKQAILDNLYYVQSRIPATGHHERLVHGCSLSPFAIA